MRLDPEQAVDYARRDLAPGERRCRVRSQMYGAPRPHFRLYITFGRCIACQPRASRVLPHQRLYDRWSRWRARREDR